jgi:AcrR family transcriptional regulator
VGHREDLLAAARRLLEEKGYAHITARDLVAASGTNLASIGYHFGSKAGLLGVAIGEVFGDWTDQLAEVAMADPDALPFERGRLAWVAMLESLPQRRAQLLSYVEALAQAERTPEMRELFAELLHGVRARVAVLVARSMGGGMTPDDEKCQALASFVIAACDGLALQWLLDPESAPTGEALSAGLDAMWAASAP